MNVERMEKLAAHLDTVPQRGFDMDAWVSFGVRSVSDLRKAHKNGYECGMSACVGGHAALVFLRQLRFDDVERVVMSGKGTETLYGSEAVGRVLGLCHEHAAHLCHYGRHRKPKAAAKLLRSWAAKNFRCCRDS